MRISYSIIVLLAKVSVISAQLATVCPKIITKAMWGGRDSFTVQYILVPVQYVIIHHTDTLECSNFDSCSRWVAGIQDYCMDHLGFNDIAYNFLVGGDGNIYQGTGWHRQGAHTRGYNHISLGIGFMGNFHKKLPPPAQLRAARRLIECAVASKELKRNYKLLGAKSVRHTESPGSALFREIQKWPGYSHKP